MKLLMAIGLWGLCFLCFSQELSQESQPSLRQILRAHKFSANNLYFALVDLDTGSLIQGHRHLEPFIPASIIKIYTAGYALEKLGPDFRFETKLGITGKIVKGRLKGDLYLIGSGDPSLTMARLMDLAMELRSKGIQKIEGNFFFDPGEQEEQAQIADFGLGDQTYNPGLGTLNLGYNRFWVWREESSWTKKALFRVMPPLNHLSVELVKKAFTPGKNFHFAESEPGEVWQLSEKLRYRKREEIPVRRPARFTAETLRYFAQFWGVDLPPVRSAPVPKRIRVIGRDKSPPLLELLSLTLEYSNNLFAEQILIKASGATSLPVAAKKLQTWIKDKVPKSEPSLVNGSGLSSQNKVLALGLANFIQKWALRPVGGRGFMSLFSISGQTGWLRKRLSSAKTAYRVWAKTGSLDYVDNMAGVLFTNSGKRLSFAVSVIDKKKRKLLDGANSKRVNKVRKAARYWRKKSNRLLNQLIDHWVSTL